MSIQQSEIVFVPVEGSSVWPGVVLCICADNASVELILWMNGNSTVFINRKDILAGTEDFFKFQYQNAKMACDTNKIEALEKAFILRNK